jgi:hypothetical protein
MDLLSHHKDCNGVGFDLCSTCGVTPVCTCTEKRDVMFLRCNSTCSWACHMEKMVAKILMHVEAIQKRVEKVEQDTEAMNSHIGFINNTYARLKTPLDFLKHSVEAMIPFRNTRSIE